MWQSWTPGLKDSRTWTLILKHFTKPKTAGKRDIHFKTVGSFLLLIGPFPQTALGSFTTLTLTVELYSSDTDSETVEGVKQ